METIRKQASKLREQVAKQQQAVLDKFGNGGYGNYDSVITDTVELQQHQKIEKLFMSTRAAKHLQRGFVRGIEGLIITGSKQVEIGLKLSEDCKKYGDENTCTNGNALSKAALSYAHALDQMEKEYENLLKGLGTQVAEPLRAMVIGGPLEEVRHLAQRYDRIWQEAEAQTIEISKRKLKVKDVEAKSDNVLKLEASVAKLQELKSNMAVLGKEAAISLTAVEAQQQKLTLQRLISAVESQLQYHQRVVQILHQLEGEMILEQHKIESISIPVIDNQKPPTSHEEISNFSASSFSNGSGDNMDYFLGEVIRSYQAETDAELNLSIGDYVVVRKVLDDGWAEGECKGKAGWFPFDYIKRRDRIPASKVAGVF